MATADVDGSTSLGSLFARLDPRVALSLQDTIKGLEAEAGAARGVARTLERELNQEIDRLRLYAAGLESSLRDCRMRADALATEVGELRARLTVADSTGTVGRTDESRR